MLFLLLSFLSPLLVSSAPYVGEERIMMIQAQSCEFSPYYKTLSCTCDRLSSKHSLNLRLEFFMKEMMQEVSIETLS